MAKAQRQHVIEVLLSRHQVTNQSQLVDLLAAEGIDATQATVSRDLDDLGAVKIRVPGGDLIYAVPEIPQHRLAPGDHLRRVVSEWVVGVASSGNLVLLRTPPGSAHVVASALDRSGMDSVLGTVAGDDTILVVVAEGADTGAVAAEFCEMAGM